MFAIVCLSVCRCWCFLCFVLFAFASHSHFFVGSIPPPSLSLSLSPALATHIRNYACAQGFCKLYSTYQDLESDTGDYTSYTPASVPYPTHLICLFTYFHSFLFTPIYSYLFPSYLQLFLLICCHVIISVPSRPVPPVCPYQSIQSFPSFQHIPPF